MRLSPWDKDNPGTLQGLDDFSASGLVDVLAPLDLTDRRYVAASGFRQLGLFPVEGNSSHLNKRPRDILRHGGKKCLDVLNCQRRTISRFYSDF